MNQPDTDRRAHRRYPITLQLQYKLLTRGRVQHIGFGQTINLSSQGALCDVKEKLPNSSRIQLLLQWPFLLQDGCPLRLVMEGRIVRTAAHSIAVEATTYEFRTVSRLSVDKRCPNAAVVQAAVEIFTAPRWVRGTTA